MTLSLLILVAAAALDCDQPKNMTEINKCSAEELRVAEEQLDRAYQSVLLRFSGSSSTKQRALITESQESWVAYRKKHCQAVAEPYAGGTLQPTAFGSCMKDLAGRRASELREMLQSE